MAIRPDSPDSGPCLTFRFPYRGSVLLAVSSPNYQYMEPDIGVGGMPLSKASALSAGCPDVIDWDEVSSSQSVALTVRSYQYSNTGNGQIRSK